MRLKNKSLTLSYYLSKTSESTMPQAVTKCTNAWVIEVIMLSVPVLRGSLR